MDDYSATYRDGEQPEHLEEQAEQQEAPEGEEEEDSQLAEEVWTEWVSLTHWLCPKRHPIPYIFLYKELLRVSGQK